MMVYRNYVKSYRTINCRFVSGTARIILKEDLAATAYKPETVEKHKYDKWEQNGLFTPETESRNPNFSMVLPPPNVTGKLHLGHALACTVQDVIVRRQRSLGYNVLWLPGTDHAGIATQGVVEKYLNSTQNVNKHDIGREAFVGEVWKWKEKYGNTICNQLRTLGASLDWSRQTFTMAPKYTNAVETAFLRLFKKGLIYRKKALVNWCNKLKSTVSDIEVDNVTINEPVQMVLPGYEKPVKFGVIYDFAYKIFDSNEEIVVSTTMPETMLGDTAIAVHPNDYRYQHLVGKRAIHPFRENTIPIIADDFVDKEFGTGAVKITPAHSKVDYEIGKHHNLGLLQVIGEDGLIKNSGKFNNLQRYECRQILVQTLDDLGLLRKINPHQMTLPVCSRTGDVIVHLPKEQWFLSCSKLNDKATQYVKSSKLRIEPQKFVKNWLNWASDDRDWCISRQLWWGHQIPAYKCCVDKDVVWVAATDEETAKIEASKYLRTLPDEIRAVRDTDVLDTWFSSGIYPFAAMGWPDHNYNDDYNRYYPLSLMATGHDILGFWVNRMVILGLELTGKLPFSNVLLHGIICDTKGAKMSKSRGNVIDPIDVINGISLQGLKDKTIDMHKQGVLNKDEVKKALDYHKTNFTSTKGIPECGVDALRFTLLSQDIKSHFVTFDVHQCHANKLFCNKIWQSIKYTQLSYTKLKAFEDEITRKDLTNFDKWILSRLADMVDVVNTSMDMYDFHLATKAIRTFVYNEFCDVYLEATKPGFDNNMKMGYAHAHTLSAALNTSLRCLAPFMVYITDELIPKIPGFENNIIHNFTDANKRYLDFPKREDFEIWKDENLERKINRLLSAISLVRELKGLYNITNKSRPTISIKTLDKTLVSDIEYVKPVILHLTRGSDFVYDNDKSKKYVRGIFNKDTEIYVEVVTDDIDNTILAARNRLEKKIKKLQDTLAKMEEKYSSAYYMDSVPEWTKLLDREKLSTKRQELEHLQRLI